MSLSWCEEQKAPGTEDGRFFYIENWKKHPNNMHMETWNPCRWYRKKTCESKALQSNAHLWVSMEEKWCILVNVSFLSHFTWWDGRDWAKRSHLMLHLKYNYLDFFLHFFTVIVDQNISRLNKCFVSVALKSAVSSILCFSQSNYICRSKTRWPFSFDSLLFLLLSARSAVQPLRPLHSPSATVGAIKMTLRNC